MRGKQLAADGIRRGRGITPAGAGKTPIEDNAYAEIRDHPRRCGENAFMAVCFGFVLGSPPQVRGKRLSMLLPELSTGITPAGAVKTLIISVIFNRRRDHPRRCGENASLQLHVGQSLGSPPQVRGKLNKRTEHKLYLRITPAGAGKTGVLAVASGGT